MNLSVYGTGADGTFSQTTALHMGSLAIMSAKSCGEKYRGSSLPLRWPANDHGWQAKEKQATTLVTPDRCARRDRLVRYSSEMLRASAPKGTP